MILSLELVEALLTSKPKIANKPGISLVLKCNRPSPNIKKIIVKHLHLLHNNSELKDSFQENPKISYRRNRNLKEIIGSNKILNIKAIQKKKKEKKQFLCVPCYTTPDNFCCHPVEKETTSKL